MKEFNTTAVCNPDENYMVDLSERVIKIKELVDRKKYFTINRARQYGKTTTLAALARYLSEEYDVISLDFQDITDAVFADEDTFVKGMAQVLCDTKDALDLPISEEYYDHFMQLAEAHKTLVLNDLFRVFDRWCKDNIKGIVLIIDEIDGAANRHIFLDFLGKLRSCYLKRQKNRNYKTFQSVILAGVTDVKHLKSKIRKEEQHEVNSPWNIAADFDIDMSLSESGIKEMLDEYERDHHTGMNTADIAKQIREYTNGYPFLVSRICQLIDEQIRCKEGNAAAWTRSGLDQAVNMILSENNTLFQSLTKSLDYYPDLKAAIRSVLMEGTKIAYNAQQDAIVQMQMYGLIRNYHNTVRVANRIFETMLYNLFLSEEELKNNTFTRAGDLGRNHFVEDGRLNMRLVLQGFMDTFKEVFGPLEDRFPEKDGRELFLLYLKPIINGTGNYYIEAQTRDQTRTDVIVDYLGEQSVIELKIWRGPRYNAEGERQICEYLDYFGLSTGYMLSFNFNKNKETGMHLVHIGDKVLYEGVV